MLSSVNVYLSLRVSDWMRLEGNGLSWPMGFRGGEGRVSRTQFRKPCLSMSGLLKQGTPIHNLHGRSSSLPQSSIPLFTTPELFPWTFSTGKVMATLKELCGGLPLNPLPPNCGRDPSMPHAPVRTPNLTAVEERVSYSISKCFCQLFLHH